MNNYKAASRFVVRFLASLGLLLLPPKPQARAYREKAGWVHHFRHWTMAVAWEFAESIDFAHSRKRVMV